MARFTVSDFHKKYHTVATGAPDIHKHEVTFGSRESLDQYKRDVVAFLAKNGFKKDDPNNFYNIKTKAMVEFTQTRKGQDLVLTVRYYT